MGRGELTSGGGAISWGEKEWGLVGVAKETLRTISRLGLFGRKGGGGEYRSDGFWSFSIAGFALGDMLHGAALLGWGGARCGFDRDRLCGR